jgi:protease IV
MLSSALVFLTASFAVPAPVRVPSNVEDVYALRSNPAGLGFLDGAELRLVGGFVSEPDKSAVNGFGAFGGIELIDGLAIAGHLGGDWVGGQSRTEGGIGVGYGGRYAAIGWSYERIGRFGADAGGRFNLGVAFHLGRRVGLGLAITDLGQNVDRRLWDTGLTIRPLDWIHLSTRWRVNQSEPINGDTLDLLFLGGAEIIDGLVLEGGADLDGNVIAQMSLMFGSAGAGLAVNGRTDAPLSTSIEVPYKSKPGPTLLEPSGVVILDLAGTVSPDPQLDILSLSYRRQPYGAVPLFLSALKRADNVQGLFVRIGQLEIGWGKVAELRSGLVAFKATGRRIDCQLGIADLKSYALASVCDTVILPPPGMLEARGIGSTSLYFADALARLGIEVEVVKHGAYKNAPDAFTRSSMSAEESESLVAFESTVYDRMIDGVVDGRKLDRRTVERIYTLGTLTASEAVSLKMADAVLYPDQIEDYLRKEYGGPLRFVDARQAIEPKPRRWGQRPRVAVIHVDSAITGGESQDLPFGLGDTTGASTLINAIEQARSDFSVVAVVLRVDSPGGDAYASDLVARAIERLDEVKPVIATFGDVAASGGYYIAAPARWIIAEPTTLTGSIGVFSLKVTVEQLLAKLGIQAAVSARGEKTAVDSPFVKDPQTREVLEKQVDAVYRDFLRVVAKGRKKSEAEIRAVAEGRIWSGQDAKEQGLVDELGGLVEALAKAKSEAGLEVDEEVELINLPERTFKVPDLLRNVTGAEAAPSLAETFLPPSLRRVVAAAVATTMIGGSGRTLALSPVFLDVD